MVTRIDQVGIISMEGTENPLESKVKNWAMASHLIGLLFLFGIPFGNILGPLILWLCVRKDHAFIDENGKEALNFQISITIYSIAALLLAFILIGFAFLFIIVIVELVCVVKAAIAASNGKTYRYPWNLRLIK